MTKSEFQWLQANLPLTEGGLGVRGVSKLALPAFLASAASRPAQRIQVQIGLHSQYSIVEDHHVVYYKIHVVNSVSKCIAAGTTICHLCNHRGTVQPSFKSAIMLMDSATDVYRKGQTVGQEVHVSYV